MADEHNPRYRYDCGRCKFHWNCGILCECVLWKAPDPPNERAMEVAKVQKAWRERREIGDKVEEMAAFFSKLANSEINTGGLPRSLLKKAEDMVAPLDHLSEDIRQYRHPEEDRDDDQR